jgi:hypothetical protein
MISQSISLSVEPHLGLMTRHLLLFNIYGLVLWGALSDGRAGLPLSESLKLKSKAIPLPGREGP